MNNSSSNQDDHSPGLTPLREEPGSPPFTRGIYRSMHRDRLWTMRQYAGYATAAESNARYRLMLDQGQTGLSVAFDLPTQIGYDSDAVLAQGEVGKVGVGIDSLADMERLFEGIPLDRVSTSMTINSTASILLALYIAVGRKQGVDPANLRGTVQNDILKEYIARGTYIYPPAQSMRLIVDLMRYCHENVPLWNTISISGYHIREAGSTAVQEVAFTLANGIAYVQAAVNAGLDVDDFAPRLSFFFNAQINLLEEVAKFRAARRIWCKIMQDRFDAANPRSWMLRFHTQTAGSSLTAQQPEINVARTTIEALAAVLGGTQSLHTNSLDEALGLPTETTARIALRTQQVIGFESGITAEPDPLGGSYYIEDLTNKIETAAWKEIDNIDSLGGAVKAVEQRYFQDAIARSAYDFQREIDSGNRVIVGVNRFSIENEPEPEILKIPAAVEEDQVRRLVEMRRNRDNRRVKLRLADLSEAARDESAHLMEPILDAVEAYCTVGEISDVFRRVWGEYDNS